MSEARVAAHLCCVNQAAAFSNLPDGAIVNVNGNNLQASYEGGDDLTLTVVP